MKYHLSCPYCNHIWWSKNPFPKKCRKCGKVLSSTVEVTSGDEYKSELPPQAILWLSLHKDPNVELKITHESK